MYTFIIYKQVIFQLLIVNVYILYLQTDFKDYNNYQCSSHHLLISFTNFILIT